MTTISSDARSHNSISTERQRAAATLLLLALILLLGGWLRFHNLGDAGVGNSYYAAAVKSMLTSWHNFFFASYEPGGSVSVDKPPLGLWVQALFAYFLGVNGFALALPQALAGWLSLPLLYHLVQRHFGRIAGWVAAFILAITPVMVSAERNNTMDGQLVFVLLLAAWAFIKATESGKLRYLWLGAFLVGIGFNIKMLQAFLPLPAFYALYWLGGNSGALIGTRRNSNDVTYPYPEPGRRDTPRIPWNGLFQRGLHLAAATILLLAVSLSWAIAVDLTPEESRPYVGSTRANRVMELILGHNGLARLIPGGNALATTLFTDDEGVSAPSLPPSGQLPPGAPAGSQPPQPGFGPPTNQPGNPPTNGAPGSFNNQEIGTAGPLRLFTEPLVTEAGWLLPLALWGMVCVVIVARPRFPITPPTLGLILWGGWLLTEVVFFSIANLFHAYYLLMVGPPLAALVAMLVWSLRRSAGKQIWLAWGLLAGGVVLTLGVQVLTWLNYPEVGRWVVTASVLGAAAGLIVGLGIGMWETRPRWAISLPWLIVLSSLSLSPLVWSVLTTTNDNPNVMLPRSGLIEQTGRGNGAAANNQPPTYVISPAQQAILEYVTTHRKGTTYLLAANSSMEASAFILATGEPVLTMGGFNGGDPVVSAAELAELVATDELGYVATGGSLRQQKPELYEWVTTHCRVVDLPGVSNAPAAPPQPGNLQGLQNWQLFACGK